METQITPYYNPSSAGANNPRNIHWQWGFDKGGWPKVAEMMIDHLNKLECNRLWIHLPHGRSSQHGMRFSEPVWSIKEGYGEPLCFSFPGAMEWLIKQGVELTVYLGNIWPYDDYFCHPWRWLKSDFWPKAMECVQWVQRINGDVKLGWDTGGAYPPGTPMRELQEVLRDKCRRWPVVEFPNHFVHKPEAQDYINPELYSWISMSNNWIKDDHELRQPIFGPASNWYWVEVRKHENEEEFVGNVKETMTYANALLIPWHLKKYNLTVPKLMSMVTAPQVS